MSLPPEEPEGREGDESPRAKDLEGESMKKALVIGSLLVVLTLFLGGSAASKSTNGAATY